MTNDVNATASSCDNSAGGSQLAYSWVVAVVLCIVAAAISNLGTNLQKLAWTKKAKYPERREKFRKIWSLGFVFIVLGAVCDFSALAFGAQSVVAPLGSLTLVANIFFAPIMHGEEPTKRDVLCTAVILAGCAVSVAFASHKEEVCDVPSLLALYTEVRFAAYASVLVVLILVSLVAIRYMERVQLLFGSRSRQYKAVLKYHRLSYAALSGLVGAQSVLFAKSVDELLVSSISGGKFFLAYGGTYPIFLAMFTCVGLQIYWLNCGLARWDALYNVPVFQAFWIVFTVIGGGVFYAEFEEFSQAQAIAFPVGVALTVVGVFFLSQRDVDESAKSRRNVADGGVQGASSANLDAPLLGGELERSDGALMRRSPATGPTAAYEYEVVFASQRLGISVEPAVIRLRRKSRSRSNKRAQKVWRVKSVSLEQQRLPHGKQLMAQGGAEDTHTNDAGDTAAAVRVGDVIVSIDGESVLRGNAMSYRDVLSRIKHAPRPVTIRFRAVDTGAMEPLDLPPTVSQRRPSGALLSVKEEETASLIDSNCDTEAATAGVSEHGADASTLPPASGTNNSYSGVSSMLFSRQSTGHRRRQRALHVAPTLPLLGRAADSRTPRSATRLAGLRATRSSCAVAARRWTKSKMPWTGPSAFNSGAGGNERVEVETVGEGQSSAETASGSSDQRGSEEAPGSARGTWSPPGPSRRSRARTADHTHPIAQVVGTLNQRFGPDWGKLGLDDVIDTVTGLRHSNSDDAGVEVEDSGVATADGGGLGSARVEPTSSYILDTEEFDQDNDGREDV